MSGIRGRGRRWPLLLLQRADVVDLRGELPEHVVHGPFHRIRGTVVIVQAAVVVVVVNTRLDIRRGGAALRRIPSPFRLLQGKRRNVRRSQDCGRSVHYPLRLVGRRIVP